MNRPLWKQYMNHVHACINQNPCGSTKRVHHKDTLSELCIRWGSSLRSSKLHYLLYTYQSNTDQFSHPRFRISQGRSIRICSLVYMICIITSEVETVSCMDNGESPFSYITAMHPLDDLLCRFLRYDGSVVPGYLEYHTG